VTAGSSEAGSREYWTDPRAFAVGRRRGRALMDRFDSLADLAAGRRSNRLDLAGEWDFAFVEGLVGFDGHAAAAAGPQGDGRIPVPALWQLHGHGLPIYLANTYPPAINKRRIPRIDQSRNEAGVYGRTFEVPPEWAGRRISVVFEGVKAGLLLYLNGREVGYSQGSFTPAEFDLTELLQPGSNRLTAVVWRYTDGTYLEDQDMWFLSGIFRPVYLLAEPAVSMADVHVRTDLDEATGQGAILAEVLVDNAGGLAVDAEVELLLREPGSEVRRPAGTVGVRVPAGSTGPGSAVARLEVPVPGAAPWTAETPNLYEVVALLRSPAGEEPARPPHQVLRVRTGIRTVRIADGQLLVNGRPIMFHGVNRHDFDPDAGWVVPEARYREDLLAAKRLNINAIRCAHYPNPQVFYDLCDELGVYVIDECDLETHGVRRRNVPGDNPLWTAAVVDRMERMVLADRNHPSIVMWSLGNEAGLGGPGGGNFVRMRAAADALDGTRPYHYEGDHQPGVSDVVSRMYATAEQMAALGRREGLTPGWTAQLTNRFFTDDKALAPEQAGERPVMLCEFAHAMGNSLGNFAEYIDVFHRYPNQLGGFIWDFVDQSIRRPGPDGGPRWHYGGDFGESPNHRYFCNNGILGPDRVEHPSAREVFWGYRPLVVEAVDARAGRFRLVNRFDVRDADEFDPVLEVRRDGVLVQTHVLDPVGVPARGRADWDVPAVARAAVDGRPGELVVRFVFHQRTATAWAPAGSPVASDEFEVTPRPALGPSPAGSPPESEAGPVRPARALGRSVAGGIQLGARAAELAGRPGRLGGRALAGLGGGLQRLSAARLPVAALTGLGERRGAPGTAATIRLAEDAEGWTVRTPRGTVRVQRDTGHLASWVVDGREVLAGPIRPNYWRALTDNDRGFGNIDARLQHVVVDPAWRDVAVQVMDARSSLGRHEASIALAVASPLFGSGLLRYDVAEDGSITVHHGLVPVQDMYRIGVTVQLPEVHSVRWYGKGPHENYIDRNRGAFTAVHELPIAAMPHHYIRPQENGNRTEVRWLEAIAPARVVRVQDITGGRLGFTAWPWTQEHLDAVEDDRDLVAGPDVTLNIDRRQRGVGGDLPGVAALLPAYTIRAGQYHEVAARFSVHPHD
jgi:beta-galactosidase/beta-glucuronidase